MKEEKLSAFNRCKKLYWDWHTEKWFKPKFDASDGKGLKEMVSYLYSLTPSEDGVVDSFTYVLNNWDRLDDYYKKQTRLRQINGNIHNIIHFFKDGNTKNRSGVSNDYLERVVREMSDTDGGS